MNTIFVLIYLMNNEICSSEVTKESPKNLPIFFDLKASSNPPKNFTTYTISLSQSAQIFWPGGNCGVDGAGLFSGAWTCLRPAVANGVLYTPDPASCSAKFDMIPKFSQIIY